MFEKGKTGERVPLYLWPFAMPGLEDGEDAAGADHDPGWFSGKEFKRKLRPQMLPNYAKLPSSITQSKSMQCRIKEIKEISRP